MRIRTKRALNEREFDDKHTHIRSLETCLAYTQSIKARLVNSVSPRDQTKWMLYTADVSVMSIKVRISRKSHTHIYIYRKNYRKRGDRDRIKSTYGIANDRRLKTLFLEFGVLRIGECS